MRHFALHLLENTSFDSIENGIKVYETFFDWFGLPVSYLHFSPRPRFL